jgi:hypothetical protein
MKISRFLLPLLFPAAAALAVDPVPDFLLPEVNTLSKRYRATTLPVSVRDYRHQITAWYFGAET